MSKNNLKGFTHIDVGDVGNILTVSGTGGLIMPKGTTEQRPSGQNGLLRYNLTNNTVELTINGETVAFAAAAAGGGTTGTFLPRSGGLMEGDLTIGTGARIILQGNATIDGVKPAAMQSTLNSMGASDGFLVRNTALNSYTQRTITGSNGIKVNNGNGLSGNPQITVDPFTLTFGGDVTNGSGGPAVASFSGVNSTSVNLYLQTTSDRITDLRETVEDYVGAMVTNGTRTGLTVSYQDNTSNSTVPGVLNFSANPYTITLGGHIAGTISVPADRTNVSVLNMAFTDKASELVLRGNGSGVAGILSGARFRYNHSNESTYLENLSTMPNSAIIFQTQAADPSPPLPALTLSSGQMFANKGTITTLTVTNETVANLTANTATVTTLDMTAPTGTANINHLNGTEATIDTLHVTGNSVMDGMLQVTGDTNVSGNMFITGSLTVSGPVLEVAATNATIKDNIIVLNKGELGSGVMLGESGIEVDRGLTTSVNFVWDEVTDTFIVKYKDGNKANFGGVANPTQGYHVGDRLYNDNRYLRDTNSGGLGVVVRLPSTTNPASTVTQARTLQGGSGVTISNADGQDGDPIISLNDYTITLQGSVTGVITATNRDNITLTTYSNTDDPTLIESVQDIVGGMVGGGSVQKGIYATYDDTTGKLGLDVNDFSLTLIGGVTGSALVTDLGDTIISCTVTNDSHTHDTRYYTEMEMDSFFEGKDLNKYQVDWARIVSKPSPVITLQGGATGSATMSSLGSATITVTVTDDSHTHDTRYYTKSQADSNYVNVTGDSMTGDLTSRSIVPSADSTYNLGSATLKYNNVYGNTFSGTASQAKYADLAERYEADAVYEPGTVVIFGGDKEITTSDRFMDTRVAGVISTQPAYMMNSEAGEDSTHPYVGLKGRVPCRVVGPVQRGDMLVVSNVFGAGCACNEPRIGSVFAKALENWNGSGVGVIEVALMSA